MKNEEQTPVQNEKGASLAFYVVTHRLTDTVTPRNSCPQGQAEEPYAGVGGAASRQGMTAKEVAGQDTSH